MCSSQRFYFKTFPKYFLFGRYKHAKWHITSSQRFEIHLVYTRPGHKMLGNFLATFNICSNFLEYGQLLTFWATLGSPRFFRATIVILAGLL